MLPQSIRPSLRHATGRAPAIRSKSCVVCTCRCGVQFWHNGDRQGYATKRRAPSTARKMLRAEATHLSPEEARLRRDIMKVERDGFYQLLAWLHRTGGLTINADSAIDFLSEFDAWADKSRGRPTINPVDYTRLSEKYKLKEWDAMYIARLILKERDPDNKLRAKKLILSLSRAGYVPATVFVMGQAHLQAKRRPAVLKSLELADPRAHLRRVADDGLDYRAMVLEGKIALALGEHSRAISLWTKAMNAAVKASEERERLGKEGKRLPKEWEIVERDGLELSSPWIELMLIHYQRSHGNPDEMAKCLWAMEIGCKQEDPTSHYYAATFTKRVDDQGNHIATSDWLYHMTKAASSGHQRACHELAVFYAQSGWKYIEDEPPDHIKPTPFDSYPSAPILKRTWTRIQELLGFSSPPKTDPRERFFHSATFPHTAVDRFKLAFSWLDIPIHYGYAPSFLFKAKMYMQETLWAGADAPKSALQLSPERYTYASGENFDAEIPLAKAETPEPQDPPNPFYDLEEARDALREVFNAYEANAQVESLRIKHTGRRLRGTGSTDDADVISRHSWNLPPRLGKWFRFPEVQEMYENELDSLYAEAKAICDEHGWDVYDEEGGLLYKAKVNRGGSEAQSAAKVVASG